MNRGVEISDEVADSAASLVTRQVRAGLVVRMAVLYDLLAGRGGGGVSGREPGRLVQAPGRAASVLVRGARVLDPGEGIDARLDVLVRDGRDRGARRGARGAARSRGGRGRAAARCCRRSSTRTCTCARPGRSTRRISRPARPRPRRAATAPCSRCRTPIRSSTPRRCSTRCTSARRSMPACASASWPRSRSGQKGEQLAPLGELADHGACGYSDDGRPVLSASLLRRALQYAATTGRVLSLHCEDTVALARGRHARGRRLRAPRPGRLPGDRGVDDDRPRSAHRAVREPPAAHLPPARRAIGRGGAAARASWGVDVSAEASPHHLLLTDEEVLSLDAARFKMSPPLAAEPHRQALIEGLRDGTIDCIATDHAPHHPAEKEVPFPAAPNGVIGLETAFPALVAGLVEPGVVAARADRRAHDRRPGARLRAAAAAHRRRAPRPISRSGICASATS